MFFRKFSEALANGTPGRSWNIYTLDPKHPTNSDWSCINKKCFEGTVCIHISISLTKVKCKKCIC